MIVPDQIFIALDFPVRYYCLIRFGMVYRVGGFKIVISFTP